MPRLLKTVVPLLAAIVLSCFSLRAQEAPPGAKPAAPAAKEAAKPAAKAQESPKPATDPIEQIKEEGLKRSQVMATLSYLTDVIGPRLTGSPNLKRANDWTRDTLTKWGLSNSHLEAWGPFGRGWTLARFSAQIVEPQCIPLIGFPKAWSPGVEGTLTAPIVYLDAKSEGDLAKYKGKLKGAVVLISQPSEVAARFEPLATRLTDKQLLDLADAPEPNAGRPENRTAGPRGGPGRSAETGATPRPATDATPSANGTGAAQPQAQAQPPRRPFRFSPEMRAMMELTRKKTQFVAEEGAALMVDVSRSGDGGTLFVQSASVPGVSPFPMPGQPPAKRVSSWDKDAPKLIPQITLGKEHYNRLVRMLQQGEKLKIAVELSTRFHDDDPMGYNTIAEIPGTDLSDEVVMLGGHMDSWHSGTGATDNAAGVSVAMEAVRIIKTLGLKPRRTIRIGLWTGEEQGLLGSRAYVSQHFGKSFDAMAAMLGTPETPETKKDSVSDETTRAARKAEYEKFSAYFNLDNGTGKIRGVYLQGNESVRPIFRKWLQPFRSMGAATLTSSNTGGTDHQSFDGIGLPAFQFIQDEIEYDTRTHHSNMDVYDRIQAEDMKQASVILAAFVYNTATRDDKMPRKPAPEPAQPARTAARDSQAGSGR